MSGIRQVARRRVRVGGRQQPVRGCPRFHSLANLLRLRWAGHRPPSAGHDPALAGHSAVHIRWRELPLCRSCDAEALETSIAQNIPVPERLRRRLPRRCPAAGGGSRAAGGPTCSRTDPEARPWRRGQTDCSREEFTPGAPASGPAEGCAVTVHGAHRPAGHRRFHERVLRAGRCHGDAAAGHPLGSHNRLTVLEEDGAADRLAGWSLGHWGNGGDRAQRCLSTICRAVDFWGARGWLAAEPAAGLR